MLLDSWRETGQNFKIQLGAEIAARDCNEAEGRTINLC